MKHPNCTLNRFWKRWRKEYLNELREAHKNRGKNSNAPRVSVDNVVIIHKDGQPRGMWKLRVVEELLVGRDQEVRAAVLRVPGREHLTGQSRNCIQLRSQKPTDESVLAETGCVNQDQEGSTPAARPSSHPSPENRTPSSISPLEHPRRAAATQARYRMLAQSLDDAED